MNVLMVTKDINVLREGTAARTSMEEYANLTSHLFVIVLNARRNRYDIQKISDKLWMFPTNSSSLWLAPLDAVRVARKEIWFQGKLQASLICAWDPCESGLAGLLIQRKAKRPLQIHVMENVFSQAFLSASFGNVIRSRIARYVLPSAQGIRVASEHIRAAIAAVAVAIGDRAFILPRFTEPERLLAEPIRVDLHEKYPAFKFIILMVAPLIPAQNFELALKVLQGVTKFFDRAGLVIVGDGRERTHILSLAKKLGVAEKVVIEASSENISSYYKTTNIFLVTAVYEEYGDTLAEAAACGAAIVTTNVGIASTIIEHGDSGFICDPKQPATFISSIVSVIQNPGLREKLKLNSSLFLADKTGGSKDEYLRIYQQSWEQTIKAAS